MTPKKPSRLEPEYFDVEELARYDISPEEDELKQAVRRLLVPVVDEWTARIKKESAKAAYSYRFELVLTNLREKGVLVPDAAGVGDYLADHPNIEHLLISVCDSAIKEFGVDAQLSIEVYEDPEIPDNYLMLYVRQEKYQKNIMKRIKAVWSAYKNSPDRELGRLFVSTDFRPPISNV
jgi:hypothetical protein